jgi:iron complex outermembrane receptor protein
VYLSIDVITTTEVIIPFDYISYKRPDYSSVADIPLTSLNTNNGTNILPLMNSIAGVYVHSGALNTNRITIRGIGARTPFSTRNIKMYYNDIPISGGDGESLMEDLDMSSFDKIFIVKGPAGTTMGAPLGGAIVLDNYEWFKNTKFTSDFLVGSYGLWRTNQRFQFRQPNVALQGFINNTISEGYRDNNEYQRQSAGVNGKIKLDAYNNISFVGHHIRLRGEIPSSLNADDFANNPEIAAFTWNRTQGFEDYHRTILGLNHTFHTSPKSNSDFIVSTSIFGNLRNQYEVRPFNILQDETNNGGLRFMLGYEDKTQDNFQWQGKIGTELLNENYAWQTFENVDFGTQGSEIANNIEQRRFANVFTEWQATLIKSLNLTVGLNLNNTQYTLEDNNQDTIDQSGSHNYGWIASPKFGINYTFDEFYLAKLQIYANYSHGFSMPSVEETLLPDGLINPDLQPESGWNLEVGTKGNLLDGKILYDFTIYRMLIDNLIVAERIDADSYVGVNAGRTQHDGVEMSIQYLANFLYSQLKLSGTYSFNDYQFLEFIDDNNDYSGNQMTGVPTNLANFNIIWQGKEQYPFYATLQYQFVDEMPMRDDNSIYSDSYQLINTKVGYQLSWKNISIDVYAGINNLLDEKYASMIAINAGSFGGNLPRYYYPGLPRNFYTGVRLGMEL